ncbi:MAG: hypothetical protein JST20_09410 [Bacteroidetes bacterium]|nr:hypothetical protein [Bacteroidota bacterium]
MTIFHRIFLVVMACILMCTIAVAQTPCNEDKGISTNPDAAVNTEKPSKQNGPHSGDNRPVIFDWRRPLFDIRSSLTTSVDINSPFYEPNNSITNHLYLSKDMRPEDGWELIKQEMGAPFDAVNNAYTSDVDYPCLILYNRYTGMLRVFVAVFSVGNFDKVEIVITLSKPPGGGFPSVIDIATSTQQKPLHALDDFIPGPELSAITRYLNTNRKWMYADFPMMYDPCICAYPSQMQINVNLISVAKVSLSGTTTGTIVNIDQTHDVVPTEKTFSMGLNAALNAGKKGAEIYNAISGFTTATLNNVNEYHGYGPYLNQEMKDKINKRRELKPAALNVLETEISKSSFLQTALKYAPVIGGAVSAALDMYSFFTGGGAKPAQPQKVEIMPMTINTTSSFNGDITAKSPYREIIFWTPGSNITNLSTVTDQYPYYNEPLGLFNLLTTPKADWYYAEKETWNPYWYADTLKIKLHDEIEYAANFAAGFDPGEIEILGALSVEFDGPIFEGGTIVRSDPSVIVESDKIVRTQYVPLGCLSDMFIRYTVVVLADAFS